MIKISDYSLNYSRQLRSGSLTILDFLRQCRRLGVDAASMHVRDLPDLSRASLKAIRRAYLDNGLGVSMFTVSTNFGNPSDSEKEEFEKAQQAIGVACYLGAPILRVFAGSPKDEQDRPAAFQRAVAAVRKVCDEAAEFGLPVGLQNHNHYHLCRTGDDVLRFQQLVNHPNFTFLLDTGQFAGSKGASGDIPPDLSHEDPIESIRKTASIASHVRVKFYKPRADGSETYIDYPKVFDILRGVHYDGIIDIVYEPDRYHGDDIQQAMPRIIEFLRGQIRNGA
jgi:sugar phosphate isomerase/epimerase